jgi:hypothetical protein
MFFPNAANSAQFSLAAQGFGDVSRGDLPVECGRQELACLDDFFFRMQRGTRHVLLLLLPSTGGKWVHSKKWKNKLTNFFSSIKNPLSSIV